MKKMAG